jgi:hypothetical protein
MKSSSNRLGLMIAYLPKMFMNDVVQGENWGWGSDQI